MKGLAGDLGTQKELRRPLDADKTPSASPTTEGAQTPTQQNEYRSADARAQRDKSL